MACQTQEARKTKALPVWPVRWTRQVTPLLQTHSSMHSVRLCPGYSPAPHPVSHPLWASLSDWRHRSELLQTRAAATSHYANGVGPPCTVATGTYAWRWAGLVVSRRHRFYTPSWRSQAPENTPARHGQYRYEGFTDTRRPVPAPHGQAESPVLRAAWSNGKFLWLLPQRPPTIGRHRGDWPDRLFDLLQKDLSDTGLYRETISRLINSSEY